MKRTIIGLFSIVLIGISYTFAMDGQKEIEVPIANNNVEASIGDIELEFCNKDNSAKHKHNLEISMKPGEKKELCMNIANNTNTDLLLDLGFVDGTFTNDNEPRKACKNKDNIENFGKFIEGGNEKIAVKAKSKLTFNKILNLNEQHIGLNNGCVVYSLADTKPVTAGGMSYKVIIRKAGFIDVNVEGEIESNIHFITQGGGNNLKQSELIIKEHESYVDIYTSITNDGNIPMIVFGSGTLTDVFGKEIDFGSGILRLLPNETRELHFSVDKERRRYFNLFGKDKSISRYRTFYFGDLQLTYEPDSLNEKIDKSLYRDSAHLQSTAFLIPRRLLVLLTLFICTITYKVIKKKSKHKEISNLPQKQNNNDTETDNIYEHSSI